METIAGAVRSFLLDRGWAELPPADIAKSISIEAAELLEIFQWQNPNVKETKEDPPKLARIQSEIADIVIYCLEMSIILDFSLEDAVSDKITRINAKYPAGVILSKKLAGRPDNDDYHRIKAEHRKLERD